MRASLRKFVYNRQYIKAGTVIADIAAWSKLVFIIGEFLTCIIDRVYYRHYLLSFFNSSEKKINKNFFNTDINKKINFSQNEFSTVKLNNYISKNKFNINDPIINNFDNNKLINSVSNKNNNSLFVNNNFSFNSSFQNSTKNKINHTKSIYNNLINKITFWTFIKKILFEKKEVIENFNNICIYFDIIRYLKIFKDIHIIQKYLFDKNEKTKIELDYNLIKNPPLIRYIYNSKYKPSNSNDTY